MLAARPPHSLVVNASGLGKDRPGSPLPDGAPFPRHGVAWELNYRGERLFRPALANRLVAALRDKPSSFSSVPWAIR